MNTDEKWLVLTVFVKQKKKLEYKFIIVKMAHDLLCSDGEMLFAVTRLPPPPPLPPILQGQVINTGRLQTAFNSVNFN